jgi:hypothetical protein
MNGRDLLLVSGFWSDIFPVSFDKDDKSPQAILIFFEENGYAFLFRRVD